VCVCVFACECTFLCLLVRANVRVCECRCGSALLPDLVETPMSVQERVRGEGRGG
jgi:hypothetical protein